MGAATKEWQFDKFDDESISKFKCSIRVVLLIKTCFNASCRKGACRENDFWLKLH